MRERLGRGDMRDGESSAMRRFQRDARGSNGQQQGERPGQETGRGQGQEGTETAKAPARSRAAASRAKAPGWPRGKAAARARRR